MPGVIWHFTFVLRTPTLRAGSQFRRARSASAFVKTSARQAAQSPPLRSGPRFLNPHLTLKTHRYHQLKDESVVSLSAQRAKYDNVKIELNLAPGLPNIKVSPSEFQQVLLNRINNAFDAMASGGGTLRLTSTLEGEHVVIEVADTGEGIPEANLPRIFDPFFTTKPMGQGTGLGLSICYGIIKNWVASSA